MAASALRTTQTCSATRSSLAPAATRCCSWVAAFLAVTLNSRLRRHAVLRSVFFASSVLSVTVVTLVWRLVYLPEHGLLADATSLVGLHAIDPVTSERWALPGIAVVTVWWIIGLPMTLFLAALQQISPEIYEAAAL